MSINIVDLREFYITPTGQAVKRLLGRRLKRVWPSVKGEEILALGYATPFLKPWLDDASRVIAIMGRDRGVAYWPRDGLNLTALADLSALPIPDESVDRVIMVHALGRGEDASPLMKEARRVLKSEGKAIVIAPNKYGWWAHSKWTPFAIGRTYTSFQIRKVMCDNGLLVNSVSKALHVPPGRSKLLLDLFEVFERVIGCFLPFFGGVFVVEATKQTYGAVLSKPYQKQGQKSLNFPVSLAPCGRISQDIAP